MNAVDPLPARTIVRAAQHECPADAAGVACIASLLALADQLQAGLRRRFEPRGLNDHKFAALMVLYTFDPVPTTATDLAFHAQLTRPATSDLLDQLDSADWITRARDPHDRRAIFVRLTPSGRAAAAQALQDSLRIFAQLGRAIDSSSQSTVARACGHLRERIPDVLQTPDFSAPSSP